MTSIACSRGASSGRRWCAVAWLSTVLLGACGATPTVDLLTEVPAVELQQERREIDFGVKTARPYLVRGWDGDERWGDTPFAWGVGAESVLEFFVSRPRPLTLRMRCWPLSLQGLPRQSVAVVLNGVPLTQLALGSAPDEYAVEVPPFALRAGLNDLRFAYAYARRPIDVSTDVPDTRSLAVAWDWLHFDGLEDSAAPTAAGATLTLPPGSEVSFFLDVPAGSELQVDAVTARGEDATSVSGILEIRAEVEGRPPQVIDLPAAASGRTRLSLAQAGPTRLSFTSLVGADGGAGATLAVARPVLRPGRSAGAAPCGVPPSRPLIVLYLIDTLRADHLGVYGYPLPTSPRIDAFARAAARFERVIAQAPWTKAAVASIFTGLTPPQHGVTALLGHLGAVPTMASLLADGGYDTAAFVTNSHINHEFGIGRGFREHQVLPERPIGSDEPVRPEAGEVMHERAEHLHRAVFAWLDARRSTAPLFLYVHASDPHAPYLPPERFRERFAPDVDPQLGLVSTLERIAAGRRPLAAGERQGITALYDAEVAYADEQFGAFLDELAARGLYDHALIVLVADHGEAVSEHGNWGHGSSLFEEQIHVPLVIKLPDGRGAGTVVPGVAEQVDLLPTLLAATGVAAPSGLPGTSLLAAAACGQPLPERRPLYSHFGGEGFPTVLEAVVMGRDKLIHNSTAQHSELYDLATDPHETEDVAASYPLRRHYLAAQAVPFRRAAPGSAPSTIREVDPAVRERLRALGYAH